MIVVVLVRNWSIPSSRYAVLKKIEMMGHPAKSDILPPNKNYVGLVLGLVLSFCPWFVPDGVRQNPLI